MLNVQPRFYIYGFLIFGILCAFLLLNNAMWTSAIGQENNIRDDINYHNILLNSSSEPHVTSPNWNEVFNFVPNVLNNCNELYEDKHFPESLEKEYTNMLTFQDQNIVINEGHSGDYFEERKVFYDLIQLPFVKTVCETGFNAGHSSFMWLASNPAVQVYSFDLGKHDYGQVMAEYLQNKYPERLTVTWGDSAITLPEFRRNHTDVKCDVIFIDGGHTTPICLSDFYNFKQMANKDNILILDNYPQIKWGFETKIGDCWEKAKRAGEVFEMFHCNYKPEDLTDMGFTVARYNL